MVEEEPASNVHVKQDMGEEVPAHKADFFTLAPFSRQTTESTMDTDSPLSRQPLSRQITPFATEPEESDAQEDKPRRRPPSPSMHMMFGMACEEKQSERAS